MKDNQHGKYVGQVILKEMSEKQVKIRSLLPHSLFLSSFLLDELEEFISISKFRKVDIQEVLFREGEPGEQMFVVVNGRIRLSTNFQMTNLTSGEFFGEISLLDNKNRIATATAIESSELLVIERKDFIYFLGKNPRIAIQMLSLLATRTRKSSYLLNADNAELNNKANAEDKVSLQVTLIGYGRYGNYIGSKYAKKGYTWEFVSIVDPKINSIVFNSSVLGQKKPNTLLFLNFTEWYENYFQHLDEEHKLRQVVEIALAPDIVVSAAIFFIRAGVKNLILPKPVTADELQLHELTTAIAENHVKAAVASQWYYSDFPKIIRRELNRMAGNLGNSAVNLHKVKMEFSKENGIGIAPPPLCELPHCLQILASSGLINFDKHIPEVNGTSSLVNVIYRPKNISQGIHITANMNFILPLQNKLKYSNWDFQERSLKIYLTPNSTKPELEVDFWIKFDRSGDLNIRPGRYTIRTCEEQDYQQELTLNFFEDQLLNMHCDIYEAFKKDFEQFQKDKNVLTLDGYQIIAQQIIKIHHAWKLAINNKGLK